MVTISLIEDITRALERDRNATRIKKLVVCACRRQWLNDRAALARLDWSELLLELYHGNATLDQLSDCLFDIVKQLNRKAEYAQVASTLLGHCEPLYSDRAETTEFLPAGEDSTQFLNAAAPAVDEYARVAVALDAHPDAQRLRKLLYCATYGEWLKDSTFLASLNLADLLAALVARYPDANYVQVVLHEIVQQLNRRDRYQGLVAAIAEAVVPLYTAAAASPEPELEDSTGLVTPASPSTAVTGAMADEDTALRPATDPAHTPTVVRPLVPAPADQATEVMAPRTYSRPETDLQRSAASSDDTTNYTPESAATDFAGTAQFAAPGSVAVSRAYDPFSVRLEVMKYANPLRAKILAFSTLHHKFEVTGNEWSSMRTRPFDELLAQLYETYDDASQLEVQLHETAKCLDAPEEDRQAAEAILQALEPFYRDRATVMMALARA